MNPLTHVTLVAMLLHSLLGCCWHHGHESVAEQAVVCHHDHRHRDADHHDADHGKPDESSHPAGPEECEASACVYVVNPHVDYEVTTAWVPFNLSARPELCHVSGRAFGSPIDLIGSPLASVDCMPLALRI